jgi:hypothetical protein
MVDTLVITPEMFILFMIVMIWSAIWKAIALWKSARNKQIGWFVVLCIFNTIGLLEVIYLSFFQQDLNNLHVNKEVAVAGKKPANKAVKRKKK